jgi:hypothetical protein
MQEKVALHFPFRYSTQRGFSAGVGPMYSFWKVLFIAAVGLVPFAAHAQGSSVHSSKSIPQPFETIKDSKQFNAVRFGPGNTFSIVQIPPDFQLNTFAMSPSGRFLAMGWASGRIELWDLHTKLRVSEFKSGIGAPNVLQFNSTEDQLVVAAGGGKLAFLDVSNGKKLKGWTIPLGKYKYDIHELILDRQGKWLAYADEETSKVLDLAGESPRQIGDLKDAYSVALSQDGDELWTVNRSELVRYSTSNWQETGRYPLAGPPVETSPALVRTGATRDGDRSVAVPSNKGLVIYREPEMQGEFVTDTPTSAVAFSRSEGAYINLSGEITLLSVAGKVLCTMSYKGRSAYAVSDDGQWLALSQSEGVDLWRLDDIMRGCTANP